MTKPPSYSRPRRRHGARWLGARSSTSWAALLGGGVLLAVGGCTQGRWAWWKADSDPAPPAATAAAASPKEAYAPSPQGSPVTAPAGNFQPVSYPDAMLPGQSASYTPGPVEQAPTASAGPTEFEPAKILARVGDEVILAGDLMGPINQALVPFLDKMPKEHIEKQRELLLRQSVKDAVDNKLMYIEALKNIPTDKRAEALPQIWERLHAKFDEEELPKALERAKVSTAAELDAKLREYGWSLAKQRRRYAERQIGMSGAADHVNAVPEITHRDLLDFYQEHADSYTIVAAARWEQVSARFDQSESRDEAYQRIVTMGNEIVLGGAPLWAVAKRSSHDSNASQGGQYDWTNQGSLASRPLDEAIFSLPVGELSPIIEDDRGFHIVRVLERRESGRTPFTEAQPEIRKRIQAQQRQAAFQEYVARLRREIPVWTIYDDEQTPAEHDEEALPPGY